MSLSASSKKEQILQLARQDPFQKIEEIAQKVSTTPRYVRTILSESRLSLMELRKDYARRMEKKLGINVMVPSNQRLTEMLVTAGNTVAGDQIAVLKVTDPGAAEILNLPPSEPLLKVTRNHLVNGRPFYVTEVLTRLTVTVGEEVFTSDRPLREVLGLDIPGRTRFVERSLEVVAADERVASALGLRPGTPVFRAGNIIETDGQKVGIEYNLFNAFRVKFVLSGEAHYQVRLLEKGEDESSALRREVYP